jgi:triacylglycerol lipase
MSPCCLALIVVLTIVVVVAAAGVGFARALIRGLEARRGILPSDDIVREIGYGAEPLPAALPDPGAFDADVAAFAMRACISAANRRIGGSAQLPEGVTVVDWTNRHTLILKVEPPGGAAGAAPLYVVACAGTLTYQDVKLDLHDDHVEFYGARAHAGFVGAWRRTYPAVRKVAAANPGAQFLVTGHSLGAAVATLVAAALGADFPEAGVALYAAATPRVGPRGFIRLLERTVPNRWHLANRADIIPTLPPAAAPVALGKESRRWQVVEYADFDRVVFFEAQGGSLAYNHNTLSYLCAVGRGPRDCRLDQWATAPTAVDFSAAPARI